MYRKFKISILIKKLREYAGLTQEKSVKTLKAMKSD